MPKSFTSKSENLFQTSQESLADSNNYIEPLSDITIILSTGDKFKSHKYLLSLYSEYFQHFFLFSQKQESEIVLPKTIDKKTFSKIYNWLYLRTISFENFNEALSVLKVSEYLSINLLVYESINYLKNNASIENCIDILLQIIQHYIERTPLDYNYKEKLNVLYLGKESVSDPNPIVDCIKTIFAFIKENMYKILTCSQIENTIELFEIIEKNSILGILDQIIYQIKSKSELETLFNFLSKLLRKNIYELYQYISEQKILFKQNKENNINVPDIKSNPLFIINIKNFDSETMKNIFVKKKLRSQRREWFLTVSKNFLSDLTLELYHTGCTLNSYVENVSVVYAIKVEYGSSENFYTGIISSHINLQRNPITIIILRHNEICQTKEAKISLWLGEIPITSGIIQLLSNDFEVFFYDTKNDKIIDDVLQIDYMNVFNVIKMPTVNVKKEATLLKFIIQYFKKVHSVIENKIIRFLNYVRVKNISNQDFLDIYKKEYTDENSLCLKFKKVNNFFKKEIQRRALRLECLDFEEEENDSEVEDYFEEDFLNLLCQPRPSYEENEGKSLSNFQNKKTFIEELKQFMFENGIKFDYQGESTNINQLFIQNERLGESLDKFSNELEECLELVQSQNAKASVNKKELPPSKVKNFDPPRIEATLPDNKYIKAKLLEIINEIHILKNENKEIKVN